MAQHLVIVESPAKAKTISGYLGKDYSVVASMGHVRDLVENGRRLPEDDRKKWWADYGVDVDHEFKPFYEVPAEKQTQVRKIKDAMKGVTSLILATDEDREGEAISWHLLQVLKPGKNVEIRRIAFHEITPRAIQAALLRPRSVDLDLVEAQEARRILDRLYGYTLSPVLWSKVTKNLSAGRVQSPAVKLVVEREIARRNFHRAGFWGVSARLSARGVRFEAKLKAINGSRIAEAADFDDETGTLSESKAKSLTLLDEKAANLVAKAILEEKSVKLTGQSSNEVTERPAPPFMTTTLQQEANRKFGFGADRTMRVAQSLYEGVALGGETVGLITYMRTDSLSLSADAVSGIRSYIERHHSDCLPEKANRYSSKVKNAQEAHEAIRPTDVIRRPEDVAQHLSEDQRKIYGLIWQRTVACQMLPAKSRRDEFEFEFPVSYAGMKATLRLLATGKELLFDGYKRIYEEQTDDDSADPLEKMLPTLVIGDVSEIEDTKAAGHETKPPLRYTDATLIKRLEQEGIGRPSTYASIISVIVDRGYVRKAGRQLIPTWKAFLALQVLESHFHELMDLGFTARMDESLDKISEGKANSKAYLRAFFLGDENNPGLKKVVEEGKRQIPWPSFAVGTDPETNEAIVVRINKDSLPFLQAGGGEDRRFANIPDDLAPADMSVEKAIELLNDRHKEAESIGTHPISGRRLLLKNSRGYYLEVERTQEEINAKLKPTWVSLPADVVPKSLTESELSFLCNLPKVIGSDPETGQTLEFRIGKFGAYVQLGTERRTVENWRSGITMTAEEATEILRSEKLTKSSARTPIREFTIEGTSATVLRLMPGRFGPYVTDGSVNATLPKSIDPTVLDAAEAMKLIEAKRAAGPSLRRKFARRKSSASKPASRPRKSA